MTTSARTAGADAPGRSRSAVFSAFAGLTALVVLLQGVWAGLFVPTAKGGPYNDTWVGVHSMGALLALLLALVTTVIGVVRLRPRRELWIGAGVLSLLLILEMILGGLVSDGGSRAAAVVHIPLALVIMAVTVWLPLRARQVT